VTGLALQLQHPLLLLLFSLLAAPGPMLALLLALLLMMQADCSQGFAVHPQLP
jgi:hypothetical protein